MINEASARYEIVDRRSGKVVGKAKTLSGALRAVDRRDNAYGAYRYFHRLAASAPVADAMQLSDTQLAEGHMTAERC